MTTPAHQYALDVVAGRTLANRFIRQACERHLRDLDEGPARGLRFDEAAAQHVINFFEKFLVLYEGEFAGLPFILQPWQQFIISNIFGWKDGDGSRRFRTAYIEIAKGNGKTPLAAGIGLYGLISDGEAGAEIYSAATQKEQAGILFRDAKNFVTASKALSKRLTVGIGNIAYIAQASFFRCISSEHRGLDGKRPHMALVDEVHEHPDDMVIEKMRAGTKGRRQAMIFEITNAGYDRQSVCFQHHEYSEKLLNRELENDSWFAFMTGLDACDECRAKGATSPRDGCEACDDWRNEAVWPKANPGLGVIIQPKYLREQVEEAVNMPGKQNIVKRLNFCIWTQSHTRWLSPDAWAACGGPVVASDMEKQVCYAGLDLSSTLDISAFVLVFPNPENLKNPIYKCHNCDFIGNKNDVVEGTFTNRYTGETGDWLLCPNCVKTFTRQHKAFRDAEIFPVKADKYYVLCRFFIPEDNIFERVRRDRVPYDVWVRQGHICATPGNVIDYGYILAQIKRDMEYFDLREIAFDRWGATKIVQDIQSMGFEHDEKVNGRHLVDFGQGFASMASPTRELEKMVAARQLAHGGNPVLAWMAGNAVVRQDPAGNMKIDKAKSTEKVDGMVALVMGLDRALRNGAKKSVYESRGVRSA